MLSRLADRLTAARRRLFVGRAAECGLFAQVRLLSEPLLGEMLNLLDSHERFDWLRGLSFIESSSLGLFPHDLAREAQAADLRWRHPDWYKNYIAGRGVSISAG